MKLYTRLMLVGGMLAALAGVSFAQQSDDRWDDEDGARSGRVERGGRGDDDRDWRQRDARGDDLDRDGDRWNRSGDRRGRDGARWQRGNDRWDRGERRWDRNDRRVSNRWERREARHEFRVRRGMRHGEITRAEAMRLRMLSRRIDLMQSHAWADRRLSARERIAVRRMLTREGRTIRRFNRNHDGSCESY
jgi:hypothetical protein